MKSSPLTYTWHLLFPATLFSDVMYTTVSIASPKKIKLGNSLEAQAQDTSGMLCCEVCGKYGLRQDFLSSGRFCSLSCVGVYTGRRNKGREFVRKVKTSSGKIVKKKKKGKGKKISMAGKTAGLISVSILFQTWCVHGSNLCSFVAQARKEQKEEREFFAWPWNRNLLRRGEIKTFKNTVVMCVLCSFC